MKLNYLFKGALIGFSMFACVFACNDSDACNDGEDGECFYWYDCSTPEPECGGEDISCLSVDNGLVGAWYQVGDYYYRQTTYIFSTVI